MKDIKIAVIVSVMLLLSMAGMSRPAQKHCAIGDNSCIYERTPANSSTETRKCAVYGTQTRTCSVGEQVCYTIANGSLYCECEGKIGACRESCGVWQGTCGICVPGSKEEKACPITGKQQRTCNSEGSGYSGWTQCPVCAAGTVEYQPCGDCGTQTRSCNSDGSGWSGWGGCQNLKS